MGNYWFMCAILFALLACQLINGLDYRGVVRHGSEATYISTNQRFSLELHDTVELILPSIGRLDSVALIANGALFNVQFKTEALDVWRNVKFEDGSKFVLDSKGNILEQSILISELRLIPIYLVKDDWISVKLNGTLFVRNLETSLSFPTEVQHSLTSSTEFTINLLFVTSAKSGVILSCTSDFGDFLLVQVTDSLIDVVLDFGSNSPIRLSSETIVNDGVYHYMALQCLTNQCSLILDGVLQMSTDLNDIYKTFNHGNSFTIGYASPIYPFLDFSSNSNFSGCIKLIEMNGVDVIKYSTFSQNCHQSHSIMKEYVVSLMDPGSKLELPFSESQIWSVSFQFRTFNPYSTIIQIPMVNGHITAFKLKLRKGYLLPALMGIDPEAPEDLFKDIIPDHNYSNMHWYTVKVSGDLKEGSIVVSIDNIDYGLETDGLIDLSPARVIFPFTGCLRNISINQNIINIDQLKSEGNVEFGKCAMENLCSPNPCKNSAVCRQTTAETFDCMCLYGYTGIHCEIATLPFSCEEHFQFSGLEGYTSIDVDGAGPLPYLDVSCNKTIAGLVSTSLLHDYNSKTLSLNNDRNSILYEFDYGVTLSQLEGLMGSYSTCEQETIPENCDKSRSHNPWWLGPTAIQQRSWCHANNLCDCENRNTVSSEHLPILSINSERMQSQEMEINIGPLVCFDLKSYEAITLSSRASFVALEMSESADARYIAISMQFRTTERDGVLLYNEGKAKHYVKISLSDAHKISVEILISSLLIISDTSIDSALNDDVWHSIDLFISDNQLKLTVDKLWLRSNNIKPMQPPTLPLISNLWKLGVSLESSAGFVGAIRALRINGIGYPLESGTYPDVFQGVRYACQFSKCMNGGRCVERYSHYDCDCQDTPFIGKYCSQDLGYTFRDVSIDYVVGLTDRSDSPKIRIAFKTETANLNLLAGKGLHSDHAINLTLNKDGHLVLSYFDQYEIHTLMDNKRNYSDGLFYDVQVTVTEVAIEMKIGFYPPKFRYVSNPHALSSILVWSIVEKDFVGCLSRVQVSNASPLKELSVDNNGRLVVRGSGVISASQCNSHPSFQVFMQLDKDTRNIQRVRHTEHGFRNNIRLQPVYKPAKLPLYLAIVASLFVAVVLLACCIYQYKRHMPGGIYKTHEGDEMYLTPDSSRTGLIVHPPPAETKKEFFI